MSVVGSDFVSRLVQQPYLKSVIANNWDSLKDIMLVGLMAVSRLDQLLQFKQVLVTNWDILMDTSVVDSTIVGMLAQLLQYCSEPFNSEIMQVDMRISIKHRRHIDLNLS